MTDSLEESDEIVFLSFFYFLFMIETTIEAILETRLARQSGKRIGNLLH